MLTCEIHPTSGTITFEGRDITGREVTEVCQMGLTKSYQVNQLFNRLTARQNIVISALAEKRGPFRLDLLRDPAHIPDLADLVDHTLDLVELTGRADVPVSDLAYGEKRRLEIGLALADFPEPASARRAPGRHEPARTGRNGEASEVDQPRPHDHNHRSRHGRACSSWWSA